MAHHHEHHCECGHKHNEHEHCHCESCGHEHHHRHEHGHEEEGNWDLYKIIIAVIAAVALQFIPNYSWADNSTWYIARLVLFLALYLFIGWGVLKEAVEGIVEGEVFDENFLMGVATVGAFALAIYEGSGDYNEAIAVMLFFQIGEFFEEKAVARSRKNITNLMDIRPDYANIERDGKIEKVNPESVEVGTIIVCQPGEKIPLDGIVIEGTSMLNTAALTGESVPREAKAGSEVISGCINQTGVLHIKTTKVFGESTVARILEMVENSANNKSHSEAFISRFAKVYTPAVCYSALALALIPPIAIIIYNSISTGNFSVEFSIFSNWIYRALIFLVISCPCALVISIPLSFFAGIGGASRKGILIKGSNYLEMLSKLKTVAFDKTGTLTKGVFKVRNIMMSDNAKTCEDTVLKYAAYAENASSHPIAKSIIEAYSKDIERSLITDIQEISGHGIIAEIEGHKVAVGNARLMEEETSGSTLLSASGTLVYVAIDGNYEGTIILGDEVKAESASAIKELHAAGIEKAIMLTGDTAEAAEEIAKETGVDEVHSGLLPAQKVEEIEKLGGNVAFVGDGINDAPVLMRADIGIAMGAMGSDAAIEAADIVLMDDNPQKVAQAMRISRHTMNIVWQNIIFAIGIKVICLILGALGIANMWLAIFADVGVMVIAVINATRALRVK